MKTQLLLFSMLVIALLSTASFAALYKSYPLAGSFSISGMAAQSQQLFPTVAVYNACKNKQVGELDHDLEEDRVEPGKCTLTYPKYCNAYRMGMMEDCVRCKHLSCPAGTFCDAKKRQCKRGTMIPAAPTPAPKKALPPSTKPLSKTIKPSYSK